MTSYQTQRSDAGRLTLLRTAYDTGANDASGNRPYVARTTLDAIQAAAAEFETALSELAQISGQRATAQETARRQHKELGYRVQEARRELRANVQLGHIPKSTLRFYPLNIEGGIEAPSRRGEWIPLAEALITGDNAAQAAGIPALTSRAALVASLAASKEAEDALHQASSAFLAIRAHLRSVRAAVDEQISDTARELRYNLAKLPAAYQRDIMRTYGFRFRSEDKPEDEETAPEAVPVASTVAATVAVHAGAVAAAL